MAHIATIDKPRFDLDEVAGDLRLTKDIQLGPFETTEVKGLSTLRDTVSKLML